jgi:hypothetical protein
MFLLIAAGLAVWTAVSLFIGLAAGAFIQAGARFHNDVFLNILFATLASKQAAR